MVNPRLLKLAERYANDKIPERKEIPKQKLEKILEYNSEGKPKLGLKEIENTVVNTPTQKDSDNILQVYEAGGWKWNDRKLPTKQPDYEWDKYKEETCIYIENSFLYGDVEYFQKKDFKAISPQEFYETQNISEGMLKELNTWFDENDK